MKKTEFTISERVKKILLTKNHIFWPPAEEYFSSVLLADVQNEWHTCRLATIETIIECNIEQNGWKQRSRMNPEAKAIVISMSELRLDQACSLLETKSFRVHFKLLAVIAEQAADIAGIESIRRLIEMVNKIVLMKDTVGIENSASKSADVYLQSIEVSMQGMAWTSLALDSQVGILTRRLPSKGGSTPELIASWFAPFMGRISKLRTGDFEELKFPRSVSYPFQEVMFPNASGGA